MMKNKKIVEPEVVDLEEQEIEYNYSSELSLIVSIAYGIYEDLIEITKEIQDFSNNVFDISGVNIKGIIELNNAEAIAEPITTMAKLRRLLLASLRICAKRLDEILGNTDFYSVKPESEFLEKFAKFIVKVITEIQKSGNIS